MSAFLTIPDGGLDYDNLLLEIGAGFSDNGDETMADHLDSDLEFGLREALRNGNLLILDTFDELLHRDSRLPSPPVIDLVRSLSQEVCQGRVLLVTNVSLGEGPWVQDVARLQFPPPQETEAVEILDGMLFDRGLQEELPRCHLPEVVSWLGRNPRAMKAFVAALEVVPLDDLLELEPEAWELREQVVSPRLVRRLEEGFVKATYNRLDGSSALAAQLLSVYRRSFGLDALERLKGLVGDPTLCREALASRFLLERSGRWLTLSPILKQIARRQLGENTRRLQLAYSQAGDHYLRSFVFTSQRTSFVSIAPAFVELRFHLLRAGREREFEDVAARYRRDLLDHFSSNPPTLSGEVDGDLLESLRVALLEEDPGYWQLRELLGRLLLARNQPGDKVRALTQFRLAARESRDAGLWHRLHALSLEVEGPSAATAVLQQALSRVRVVSHHWEFLLRHAEHLGRTGDLANAYRHYSKALSTAPEEGVAPICLSAARVLDNRNRGRDAVDLLIHGARKLGNIDSDSLRLIAAALLLIFKMQDQTLLANVRNRIHGTAEEWDALVSIIEREWFHRHQEAAELAERHPECPLIAIRGIFNWLCARMVGKAIALLDRAVLPGGSAASWIRALCALCADNLEIYEAEIQSVLRSVMPDGDDTIDRYAWLRAWWAPPKDGDLAPSVCFPRLPAGLTGREEDLKSTSPVANRIPSVSIPRLRTPILTPAASADPCGQASMSAGVVNLVVEQKVETVSKYENKGQVGAMGDNARAEVGTFTQGGGELEAAKLDLPALVPELERLRKAMRRDADSDDQDKAVVSIGEAIAAASEGDEGRTMTHLRAAGQWAWKTASSIGVVVAASALGSALGIS